MDPSPIPVTRQSLLARLRIGDPRAWEEFVEIYGPNILRWCKRHLQEADADDASQDVLIKLSKAIKTFNYDPQRGKFRGWLKTVTDCVLKDLVASQDKALGKKKPDGEPGGDGGKEVLDESENRKSEDFDGRSDVDGRLNDEAYKDFKNGIREASQWELLQEAKDRVRRNVPPEQWEIFRLRIEEGLAPDEVASKLNIKRAKVDWTKCRVETFIKREIRKLEDGEDLGEPSDS